MYGDPTEVTDLPAGVATYAGNMRADMLPADTAGTGSRSNLRGDLMLRADFGQSTVDGSIDNLEFRPPDASWRETPNNRTWTIENGTINGNALAADLDGAGTFDGEMEGQFFGPGASEVGGTIVGTGTASNLVVYGWFGGKKQ